MRQILNGQYLKERILEGGFIGSDKIISQIKDGTKKIRVGIKPEGRLIAREKTKILMMKLIINRRDN